MPTNQHPLRHCARRLLGAVAGASLLAVWFAFTNVSTLRAQAAPGGPILVVASTASPFSQYYAEILRAEGLNAFTVLDITTITSSTLNSYDVAILGEIPLTTDQVTMFSSWVAAGGNLIAMRPDKQLAGLLGLIDATATLSDAYLQVDTAAAPGAGIAGQTMQFHGTADRYTASGATTIATLHSNGTTATTNPAVTVMSVGSAGGQAAAFAYDLARSVVYTRQGNPAWSGQERDARPPIRSDDLFFGGSQPNYVDLSKVAIPQADEQQRLLANLIAFVNADRKPLPKFWYFPRGFKAVVVMTGDDHANNGTAGRFAIYNGNSAPGCSVTNWDCVRATSYIFPQTPISPAQVASFVSQGFEIGAHMWMSGNVQGSAAPDMSCHDYTTSSINADYTQQLTLFASLFPSTTPVRTTRTHCIVWSDYDTQPQVALANGIRLDTTYYYWPDTWVNDVPGLFTGSGMPMRFAKADGTMIDVYQAPTQMTDESGQTFPFTVDTLLDRALGPEGYYGAFVANMHTDTAVHGASQAIVASAQARGVPIVSAAQMLDWLDGRNGSSFGSMTWDGSTLAFSVSVSPGANNLQAMLPIAFGGNQLTSLTVNGSPVNYTIQPIKGVTYAMFASSAGSYRARYAVDTMAPVISAVSATPAMSAAVIAWSTDEATTSRVDFGTNPNALGLSASVPGLSASHSVQLVGLNVDTPYYYRVTSADSSLNATTSPAAPDAAASFTTLSLGCPCSIWTPAETPSQPSASDGNAIEVGLKFRTTSDGFITGIRFYKGASNTGSHVGHLWTAAGSQLASVTFSGESASGWQQALFSSPVAVTASTMYVVSYHTDSGFYSADGAYFQTSGVTNGPLHALANGVGGPNGVFRYGTGGFPTDTFNATNYWVDVVFDTSTAPDITPPVITATAPAGGATGVPPTTAVTATFSEDLNSTAVTSSNFVLLSATDALVGATVTYNSSNRTATLQPTGALLTLSTYTARVSGGASGVTDPSGNALEADVTWTFTTSPPSVADTTVGDFAGGTLDAGTYISQMTNGELILAPAAGTEFSGSALPIGWSATPWNAGSTTSVSGGQVVADGARVNTDAVFAAGQSLEFVATFSTDTFEHAGFGVTFNESPWAMFGTAAGGGLYAGTNDGAVATDTLIPGSWLGTAHRYRIDWTSSSIVYSIDGAQVASHAATIGATLRPIISDFNVGSGSLAVDWIRLTPYATSGTFTSRVLDSGATTNWSSANWTALVPPGTALAMSARFGNTPTPDATWTGFQVLPVSGTVVAQASRYVQYTAILTSTGTATAVLQDVTFAGPLAAVPAISVNDVSVPEGNSGTTSATFTLLLSAAVSNQVSVAYATVPDSATSGTDFTAVSGTAVFPAGTTSVTIPVPVVGDTVVESNETFFLNLSAPVNATIAGAQAVGTIANDDTPNLTIGNATVTEGNVGPATAQFTVTLAPASPLTVTVGYTTANGTAVAGADYTASTGTLTFVPNATVQTISVPILADTLDEANETFAVNLRAAINATIAAAPGVGTITDDDVAPSLAINNVTVTEGNAGTVNAAFTVTLSATSGQMVTVAYATANGTATAPADYAAASGTLTFAAGATSQTISVPIVTDVVDEPNETFTVNVSAAVNASIADTQGVGTITDDDLQSLAIDNVTVTEGNSGTVNAVFTVTLSSVSGQTVAATYTTANGTATAPADYTTRSGLLTFAPGTTTRTITVAVVGDARDEADETFAVNLGAVVNATIADSQGVGTIVDNDPTPSLAINNVTVTEPGSGTANAVFTVTLSAASGQAVTVNYATANGTAVAGSDYTSKSGQLAFSPGTTTQTISVSVPADTFDEAIEAFNVNVSGATNATISDSQGVGTIVDSDPTPSVSINSVSAAEGDSGTRNFTFTLTLSAASGQTVTVNYATTNLTAQAGNDYTAKSGTVTFNPGTTTQTISVVVLADTRDESSEYFFVVLSNPSKATIANSLGLGTILNDD